MLLLMLLVVDVVRIEGEVVSGAVPVVVVVVAKTLFVVVVDAAAVVAAWILVAKRSPQLPLVQLVDGGGVAVVRPCSHHLRNIP
jgi:hypothetical protein